MTPRLPGPGRAVPLAAHAVAVGAPTVLPVPLRRRQVVVQYTVGARHRRWAGPAAIVGAGALVGLVVFGTWFRTGVSIARGDIAVPVREGLGAELGDQWTHLNTGAGGPTYELVRLPELASFRLAEAVGGGEALGQRILYTVEYGFAAAAVAALALAVTRRPVAAVVGATTAFANPYTLNMVPNTLPMLAIGTVAAITAPFVVAARSEGGSPPATRRWLVAAVVAGTLPCSYLSVNPPLLALVGAAALVAPLLAACLTGTGRRGARRGFGLGLRAAPWALAVNLWWLVPMGFALSRAVGGGTVQAETDVATWSWTHRNNSVANVLTMVANWTWGDPVYHARAVVDSARSIQVGAWAFPAIVAAGPLAARPHLRRVTLWCVVGVVLVVPLAKGLHEPFGAVDLWLFERVPGAWLFREPMSKLGVVATLACATSAACLADAGASLLARTTDRARRPTVAMALGLAFVVPASVCWPMWTGAWVPTSDGAMPGAEVVLPQGWREVATAVNSSPVQGKALVLPLGDFYQLPTTWGYYGIDNTARQLLTRPVIVRQPESYIGDPPAFEALARGAEGALLGDDPDGAASLLRALGVSHVVVRHDLDRRSAIRRPIIADDTALGEGLDDVAGLTVVAENDIATVWEVGDGSWSTEPVQVLGGLLSAEDVATADLAALVTGTAGGLAAATGGDPGSLALGEAWAGPATDATLRLGAREVEVDVRSPGEVLASFEVDGSSLVVGDPMSLTIGAVPVARRADHSMTFDPPADGAELVGVEVDGVPVALAGGPALAAVPAAGAMAPLWAIPGERIGRWGAVADCNRMADVSLEAVGIVAERARGGPIRLHADAHSACVAAPVAAAEGEVLQVDVSARTVEGGPARACLWFPAIEACAPLAPVAGGVGDWVQSSSVVTVPDGAGEPSMFLYADAPRSLGPTTTEFAEVAVSALRRGAPVPYRLDAVPSGSVDLDGDRVRLDAAVGGSDVRLAPWSPVADCYREAGRTLEEAGITGTADGRRVTLEAAAGLACVEAAVDGVTGGMLIELQYRREGAGARTCLWQTLLQRCAAVESRDRIDDVVVERVRIAGAAGPVRLFLYADPREAGGHAAVEYDGVRLRLLPLATVRVQDAGVVPGPTPTIEWSEDGPTRYRVRVEGATDPFVLTLAETFSPDWRLTGVPAGTEVAHVELDGYRNGWVLDAQGTYEVTIEYVPARYGRLARSASAVAALAGIIVLRPRRRRAT